MKKHCLIIGAGHAGIQAATLLREEGFDGEITLFSDETVLPYQKPPLSKGFLVGKQTTENLLFRNAAYFEEQNIRLELGQIIVHIDTNEQTIQNQLGKTWAFSHLILATGARNRTLPLPEFSDKVFTLRTLQDAQSIRQKLETATQISVIGGGFIGLETAAAAIEMGKKVTVFETGERLMQRVLPPVLSSIFLEKHLEKGVDVRLQTQATYEDLKGSDLIVVGIGVLPNQELAEEAGLTCSNGIEVNVFQQTSHPSIYAIGDCALHFNPFAGRNIRLESVQNANDQAKTAVLHIVGRPQIYQAVPWFWTNQFDLKLQMAGINTEYDRYEIKGEAPKFSVYYYKNDQLIAVDSLNKPADHLAARKALAEQFVNR